MPDALMLAYLAGVVDSDGYITIHRSRHAGVDYYGARVGIAGTSSEPHDLASELWGGVVSVYAPKDPTHRSQFHWSRTGHGAARIIGQLEPYLRVKRQRAHLALALQAVVTSEGSSVGSPKKRRLHTEMRALMTRQVER